MPDGWKTKNQMRFIDFTVGCDCKMPFKSPPGAGFNLQRTGSIPSNSTGPTKANRHVFARVFRPFLALSSRLFSWLDPAIVRARLAIEIKCIPYCFK
jgi:hypothetical protein